MIAMISSGGFGFEMASREWAEIQKDNESYDFGKDEPPEEQKHEREPVWMQSQG